MNKQELIENGYKKVPGFVDFTDENKVELYAKINDQGNVSTYTYLPEYNITISQDSYSMGYLARMNAIYKAVKNITA